MQGEELKGRKEVDTLRVTLLGFSLISIIILSLSVFYVFMRIGVNYKGFLPDTSDMSLSFLRVLKVLLIVVLILPQVISLLLWLAMPSFIKRWYNLQDLPPEYTYIYDHVQEIASEMGIKSPKILYTQKEVANCFNLGRTEWESTVVISKWVADHLHSDELRAVLIHEMAHTKNRDVTLMAYFSAVKRIILVLPPVFLLSLIYLPLHFGVSLRVYLDLPIVWIFFGYLTFVCISIIFGIQWFSRLREVIADARVSLFIDKNILKRTLYKLACARSIRILFVSSSLMMSGARKGGIFSTHPPLRERYLNLDKKRFIIDADRPPSLKFCFTTALSIFLFIQFISYIIGMSCYFITNWLPQGLGAILLLVITAGLLLLYYQYLSIKYIGVIIFLITLVNSALILGLMLYAYISWIIFPPSTEILPPENLAAIEPVIRNLDFAATTLFLLLQTALNGILTFLIIVFLRFAKKWYKK